MFDVMSPSSPFTEKDELSTPLGNTNSLIIMPAAENDALFALPLLDSDGCLKPKPPKHLDALSHRTSSKLRINIPRHINDVEKLTSPNKDVTSDIYRIRAAPLRPTRLNKIRQKNGENTEHSSTLSLYQLLYEEHELLGKGGLGIVYKVRNRADGMYYAVKKFFGPSTTAGDTRIMHLDHQNIVRYFNCFSGPCEGFSDEEEEISNKTKQRQKCSPLDRPLQYQIFIVMQYYSRGTLHDYLKKRSSVVTMECRDFSLQIAEGLRYLHGRGIIHRDLKPANLFLTGDNQVKIGDFDLATTHWGPAAKHSRQVGTPAYASPEQWSSGSYSCYTDHWSLGIIMYELFSVFTTSMERDECLTALRRKFSIPAAMLGNYPTEMSIIQRLLNFVPEARLSLLRVIKELRSLMHSTPSSSPLNYITKSVSSSDVVAFI